MFWFWLALTLVLLAAEAHTTAFYAMFVALGTLAAAIIALLGGDLLPQVAIGGGVALLGAAGARPLLLRLLGDRLPPRLMGGTQTWIGRSAVTLDPVGDEAHAGHVLLDNERWLAVSTGGDLEAGAKVMVIAVHGTTLVVQLQQGS